MFACVREGVISNRSLAQFKFPPQCRGNGRHGGEGGGRGAKKKTLDSITHAHILKTVAAAHKHASENPSSLIRSTAA